ncbi:hypothetical protein [Legionella sp. km772]|uniref:hypothetical protein n=1 Tax=Legionella sp. km772 TaxID=2498111 RepID=UPI000F8D4BFA|nr:hypothetical protein [Legionella sp. km772]RUR13579.1 hypothetical protein ELY15_01855 [Legionella sp. km772]
MFYKIILFSVLSSFSFQALATEKVQPKSPTAYSQALLTMTLAVIKDCYKNPNQVKGEQLVRCVAKVFDKEVANPEHYKINLSGDCPGNVDLLMYNVKGEVINCYLTLTKSVNVNRCISYKIPHLSMGEEMSITPPQVLINN